MTRKKKVSRKYEPRNEFRKNRSPLAKGHPHYVFGEKNGKYKSLGITHQPVKGIRSVKLSKNPDPLDVSDAYLQLRVHTTNKKYYGGVLPGWSFTSEDMAVVRNRTKKYKKAYNRKPPMHYDKKNAQKKKRTS